MYQWRLLRPHSPTLLHAAARLFAETLAHIPALDGVTYKELVGHAAAFQNYALSIALTANVSLADRAAFEVRAHAWPLARAEPW